MVKKKAHSDISTFLETIFEKAKENYPDWPKELVEIHATDAAIEILCRDGYMDFLKR